MLLTSTTSHGRVTLFHSCFNRECSFFVGRGGGKFDWLCSGVVDEVVDLDESSQPAGIQSNVTADILAPTPVSIPGGVARSASGRGTAVGMEEV